MRFISAPHRPSRQRGFSFTETIVVILIVSVVLGVVWTAASNVSRKADIEETLQDVMMITQNIRHLYGERNFTAAADLTELMANSGVFPPRMFHGGLATPRTPFETNVRITTPGADIFWVIFDGNLPRGVCPALLSRMVGTGRMFNQEGGPFLRGITTNAGDLLANLEDQNVTDIPNCMSATLMFQIRPPT